MPPSDASSELLEEDDDPLFPFGPMPTEPLIARGRAQAFRFLSYGKGTRCVITEDYELMVAVGRTKDLKGYVNGWFRAHGNMCRVAITQAPAPGWSQMILALDEDFRDHGDDGDVELDMGFLDSVDYLAEDGDSDVDDDDMLEALDLDPDYLPHFNEQPMSDSDVELDDDDDDDDDEEHCENCGSEEHNLERCSGPTDVNGYLRGCPFCNTTAHDVDGCELLDWPASDYLVHLINTNLLLARSSRAPFRSARMPWTRALRIAQAWGYAHPGPLPWSHEMALRMKSEVEADLAGHEGFEEIDPVTGNVEAVEVAIKEGRVPAPGDIEEWMPPAGGNSPVL
ncbi:hypothetical protein IMZ48_19330 [Candidatus Bathyarchaeota archaeon]|nr:hypothetical protein [Candidatus Bathyarchaeota archaeon]